MSTFEAIILALIQGLTEFLPISSSAHLILPSQLLGWPDQGLAFDVAVHVGTLAAVVFYYRKEVAELVVGWFNSLRGQHSSHSRLAWFIIWATVPAALAGLLGNDLLENFGRSALVIASSTIAFGLVLWYADARASETSSLKALTLKQALLIGVAQAIALIPGTSRSGITITAGLLLGLTRMDAARFSFYCRYRLLCWQVAIRVHSSYNKQSLSPGVWCYWECPLLLWRRTCASSFSYR